MARGRIRNSRQKTSIFPLSISFHYATIIDRMYSHVLIIPEMEIENKVDPFRMSRTEDSMEFRVYTGKNLEKIPQIAELSEEMRFAMQVVAKVLPFRINNYVCDELIDWDDIPKDPIYQLTFPQKDMLTPSAFQEMADLVRRDASQQEIDLRARRIRADLNPHPAGQLDMNVARLDDAEVEGMQHKYRETVLFFPSQGQFCHSYCTFCFRWAQFIGDEKLRIASKEAEELHEYLRQHKEVSDLLVTGGDPMVMKSDTLGNYIEPLASAEYSHIQNIRIGTKALSFWPYRFISDPDSDDLAALLERMIEAGKHIAIMAHFDHWREMQSPACHAAIERLRSIGAEIRCQAPLIAHINDDPDVWARMWREQVRLGMVPYYMFIERNTGAHHYFELPLYRAWEIYRDAIKQVSGLSRTVRGPSMSCGPGKIEIQGVSEVRGEKVFVLRFIQGRNPEWVQKPFFAKYNQEATWLDHLEPAFGEEKFFFEEEFEHMASLSDLD